MVRSVVAPSSKESLWQAGDGSGWGQKLPGWPRVRDGEGQWVRTVSETFTFGEEMNAHNPGFGSHSSSLKESQATGPGWCAV